MRILVLILACFGGFAWAQADREDSVSTGFKIPELDENGVMKSMMTGQKARMSPGKPLEIEGLMIEFYEKDGKTVAMRITSPFCTYDARSGMARSEESVRILGKNFQIRGKGFDYETQAERMELHSNVKVILRNLSPGQALSPTRNSDANKTAAEPSP